MRAGLAITACLALAACGTETTNLIPLQSAVTAPLVDAHDEPRDTQSGPCFDPAVFAGGGIYKTDFSDLSDMTINEEASSVGGALRLVNASVMGRGSAYFNTPIMFDGATSIFAHFTMWMGGGNGVDGGDGLAFVLQNDPMALHALGSAGGGIGYRGVKPSVTVEFDTINNPENSDPDGNHVALMVDGDIANHIAHASPAFTMNDGIARQVWIDYDGSADTLEVYIADTASRPSVPVLSHSGFDFGSVLGPEVYWGMSAAVGELKNDHELRGEAWFVATQLPKCR